MKNSNSTSFVYQEIKNKILYGDINSNQPLVETAMCQEFNVSRTPVREAFRMLAKDNLITLTPNKGAIVNLITEKDIDNIFEIRCILESWAISEATRKISDENLEAIKNLLDEVDGLIENDKKEDLMQINEKSDQLHDAIALVIDNRWYSQIVADLSEYTKLSKKLAAEDELQIMRAHSDHKKILAAMQERNVEKAKAMMIEHIKNTQSSVQKNRKNRIFKGLQ